MQSQPFSRDKFEPFLADFRQIIKQQAIKETQTSIKSLARFFEELKPVLEKQRHYEKTEAPGFNVFQILNIVEYEEKTHTPFLENLLNVNGPHGQGRLFYDSFLQAVKPHQAQRFLSRNIRTSQEQWTGDGEIDIFIESTDPKQPFCIVIENKINARDQSQQLARYYTHARIDLGYTDDQILLLYLTKNGNQPSEFSIPAFERIRLTEAKVLQCISYREHIRAFLENAVKQVQAPAVQFIIHQYLKTIRSF